MTNTSTNSAPQQARAYVDAFSTRVGDTPENYAKSADGSFSCMVSNVRFDFQAAQSMLIVRAVVEASLPKLRGDVMQRLRKIEADTPNQVDHARFEYIPGLIPAEPASQSLFLRTDIREFHSKPQDAAERIFKLSQTAYAWNRGKLLAVIKEANASLSPEQLQQLRHEKAQ